MNNPRRKALQALYDQLTEIKDQLDEIRDEEEVYRDNIPENLQGSERYEKAEAACDSLYEAASHLDDAIDNIESATE